MSAIFSYAIRLAYLKRRESRLRSGTEGTRSDPECHAYTLDDVELLKKLPETARTFCVEAAFAGLCESEIRG
jgi:hypothetical protein